MATLYHVELFTLHGFRFRFQLQLPTTGMASEFGSESESRSVNVSQYQLRFIFTGSFVPEVVATSNLNDPQFDGVLVVTDKIGKLNGKLDSLKSALYDYSKVIRDISCFFGTSCR